MAGVGGRQDRELVFNKAWRRQWHPTPVLLLGKSYGWRSLVGCSPWGREESNTTERLHFHFSLSCIGEGNGNPLQCSYLGNPRDGGAWWAAVSGVAQSWTRLKWLSSSSSSSPWDTWFPDYCGRSRGVPVWGTCGGTVKWVHMKLIFSIIYCAQMHLCTICFTD